MSTAITAFFNKRTDSDKTAKSMFCGTDGNVAEKTHTNVLEFLTDARRDYGIARVPALVMDPNGGLDDGGNIVPTAREVDNQFHLIRQGTNGDGHVVSPKTVSAQYAPYSLADLAGEIQPWCDAGWATPDAVFDGKNGSLELITLRLDAGGQMPGWDHQVILRVPHGTGGKVTGTLSSFRTVCSNVFGAQGRGREFIIPHRISAKMSTEEIQKQMAIRATLARNTFATVNDYIAGMAKQMNSWENVTIDEKTMETMVNELLGIEHEKPEDIKGGKKNMREEILTAANLKEFGTYGKTLADFINGVTFYNSSPLAAVNQKSKVSGVDRMLRNVAPNASGWILEKKAAALANAMLTRNS